MGREEIPAEDQQVIVLALARLSLERPGFTNYLGQVASRFGPRDVFEAHRKMAVRETALDVGGVG